jgi:hypothetical protein
MIPWRTIQIVAGVVGFLALLVMLQLFQNGGRSAQY